MQCRSGNILLNAERAKIADAGETCWHCQAQPWVGCSMGVRPACTAMASGNVCEYQPMRCMSDLYAGLAIAMMDETHRSTMSMRGTFAW